MLNTLASQLALLNLDFNDHITVVEDDEERKDALGDLPDWDELTLNDFMLDHYYRTRKGRYTNWHIIESKLGDGFWTGKPTWKGDAQTDSINILAAREVTMLKFLYEDEVAELYVHIEEALNAGDKPVHAAEAAVALVYEHAREARWVKLHKFTPIVKGLLSKINYKHTINHLYATCQEMVAEGKSRDEWLEKVQSELQVKVFGRPWKYFNELYWLVRFNWHIEEPNEIMVACANRYADAINFYNTVHGD